MPLHEHAQKVFCSTTTNRLSYDTRGRRWWLHLSPKISRNISLCLPTVLVPSLDLSLSKAETFRHVGSICDAQVLLTAELSLEELQLGVREGRPSTSQLLRRQLALLSAAAVLRRLWTTNRQRLLRHGRPDGRAMVHSVSFKSCDISNSILADRTACNYWHHTVVCLSVSLYICRLVIQAATQDILVLLSCFRYRTRWTLALSFF